jgi:hypothetical protein
VVNCSPKANSTAGTANATINSACPSGGYYSNGVCYNPDGSQVGSTFSFGLGFYSNTWGEGGSYFQITNIDLMKQFFKYGMGVCDRGSNNYGTASCDYYIRGQTDLVVQLPSNFTITAGASTASAMITVASMPYQDQYIQYQASGSWWSLLGGVFGVYIPDTNYYSGAYRNPLQIQAQASVINNNAGFSVSGYGDAWTGYNNTLVTIEVASGSQTSSSVDYIFKVGGQEAARGRMIRCQSMNCGI